MPLRSERRYIGVSNVTSGMIVQFNYTKLNGDSGQYTILVVDPYRKNDRATEYQLHGYDVKDMSDEEFFEIYKNYKN